jgi:general secretion pathway protein F
MPDFQYLAVDGAGVQRKGRIEAPTPELARRRLRDRNLLPISLSESGSARTGGTAERSRSKRLALQASALAFRQLATLTASGVRVEEALRLAGRQAASPAATRLLDRIRTAVIEGRSLAAATADQNGAIAPHLCAALAAGERAGRLPDVLAHLAQHLENQHATQRKLGLALLYPGLLAFVSIVMVTLLLVYVTPDIVRVFSAREADLPALTKGLIAVSTFLASHGLTALAVGTIAMLLGWRWSTQPANRALLHALVATTPPSRSFSQRFNAARFASTLAILVQSGAPLLESLRSAAAAVGNLHIRTRIDAAAQRVHDGASLSQSLDEARCFPPMLLAMVASGESTGRLGPALEHASTDLQRDIDHTVATLVGLAEPLVLLLMGGVVLVLVLAILSPIAGLNNLAG